MGAAFVKVLIVEYLAIAIAYGCQGDWARVAYFTGAIILSFGVLYMR
jgi:hypothetical protein